jgi:hypothetical protein
MRKSIAVALLATLVAGCGYIDPSHRLNPGSRAMIYNPNGRWATSTGPFDITVPDVGTEVLVVSDDAEDPKIGAQWREVRVKIVGGPDAGKLGDFKRKNLRPY